MTDLVRMTFSFEGEPHEYRALVDLKNLPKNGTIKVAGLIQERQPDGTWAVKDGPALILPSRFILPLAYRRKFTIVMRLCRKTSAHSASAARLS